MLGPDAQRYLAVADRVPVPRPFHLRWLLPAVCRRNMRRWWAVWLLSWPALAAAVVWWQHLAGVSAVRGLATAALLLALPGILGPDEVRPVGVDLPATALAVAAAAMAQNGGWWLVAAVAVSLAAGSTKETAPVAAALCAWSLWPLVGLLAPLAALAFTKAGPDPLGPAFQQIADHPVRAALAAHRGRWRDGWLMAAPWGICLIGLYRPSWQVVAVLTLAYAQLVVATDTVRLVHHLAGPVLAAAAVHNLPAAWLLPAVAVHTVWWWTPERI